MKVSGGSPAPYTYYPGTSPLPNSLDQPLQLLVIETGEEAGCIFDVRIVHPNALSYCNSTIPFIYRRDNKRVYSDQVVRSNRHPLLH